MISYRGKGRGGLLRLGVSNAAALNLLLRDSTLYILIQKN